MTSGKGVRDPAMKIVSGHYMSQLREVPWKSPGVIAVFDE